MSGRAAAYAVGGTPRDVSADGEWKTASGWLDPVEPFLADHQPGGCPLLGTVGGLEVLADWIAAVEGTCPVAALEAVEAIRPIVFEGGAARRVTARWRVDGAGRTIAELRAPGDNGGTLHLRCVFVTGEAACPQPRAEAGPRLQPEAVGADEIYRVFFHGPTFRVVARAQFRTRAMLCELASSLPRWSSASSLAHIAPRLIEFGLQTAGLLQLALDGAMMIPRTIERIDRFRPTDVDHAAALFAVAERAGTAPSAPIDIRILDSDGAVHLAIAGYRCVPLPFATDDARQTALAQRLRDRQPEPQP